MSSYDMSGNQTNVYKMAKSSCGISVLIRE